MTDEEKNTNAGISSLEEIVLQLEDLIKFIIESQKKEVVRPIPYPEVNKQLIKLKELLSIMQVSFEKTLEQLSLTPEDVERAKEKIMHTQGPERHLFDKIEQLKQICEEQKTQIHESLQEHREEVKIVQEELEDESVRTRRRKGKFKRTGSKKGWLPS